MTYKDELLEKLRRNTHEQYPMPDTPIDGISYDDTVKQFVDISMSVGSKVVMAKPGEKLDDIVRSAYPEAKTIASNIAELTIATINPDTVAEAQDLNGTDVGVVYGQIGVAENDCVWIPQDMKERKPYASSASIWSSFSRRAASLTTCTRHTTASACQRPDSAHSSQARQRLPTSSRRW